MYLNSFFSLSSAAERNSLSSAADQVSSFSSSSTRRVCVRSRQLWRLAPRSTHTSRQPPPPPNHAPARHAQSHLQVLINFFLNRARALFFSLTRSLARSLAPSLPPSLPQHSLSPAISASTRHNLDTRSPGITKPQQHPGLPTAAGRARARARARARSRSATIPIPPWRAVPTVTGTATATISVAALLG